MATAKKTTKKPAAKKVELKKEPVKKAPVQVEEEVTEEVVISPEMNEVVDDGKGGKKEKYFQTVGRRKESVAIVRLYTKKSTDVIDGDNALVIVNDKDYRKYFSDKNLQQIVESPLRKLKSV